MKRWLIWGALVAVALTARGGEAAAACRFSKEVRTAASAADELVAIPLDAEVYAATLADFADLRVMMGTGEAPYLLTTEPETQAHAVRRPCASVVEGARPQADNQLEIRVRLAPGAPPAGGLTILTPLRDFERRVTVFGRAAESADWQPLTQDALIFDYSRFLDVARREVTLPANACRQFRVVIDQATEEQRSQCRELTRTFRQEQEESRGERTTTSERAFRVDRVELWAEVVEQQVTGAREVSHAPAAFTVTSDAARQQTVVEVTMQRQPLTAFHLATTSRNFSRRVTVQAPRKTDLGEDWVDLGAGTISNLSYREDCQEQLRVTFPERRGERYRLVIANGDSLELQITGVTARGPGYRLIVLGTPGAQFRVCYGAAATTAPSHDTAALRALLARGVALRAASLGAQLPNPDYRVAATARPRLFERPWTLGVIACLLVAVLGLALVRAGRKVGDLPKEG